VIKIKADDLPFITIADSDKIEVGDLCLAIGNPFGIGQTVTMGIISALGRNGVPVGDMTDKYHFENFIQTDAAINPGNSGGALVDTEGRLIGINTAILSRTGGYEGIGFAVPVNMARNVMESLIAKGKVDRGYMGVSIQDVNPALAEQFGLLPDQHGALISDVMPDSPADKAGLKGGDVVLEFNGKTVPSSNRLQYEVAGTAPGATVPVKILRNGKEQTIQITVRELPGSEQVAKADKEAGDSSDSLNGVTVSDIDPRAAQQMNLPQDLKGAVITDVDQDSAAYDAGLRPGSVIQEINHKPVQSADDAVKFTENLKNKKILLKVWSDGGSHYLVVDESKAG
ncbi:MAG TPA: PDZ domain-containing protein, partial [Verrucomicrobiae bacterium]|nr:PDZ domain-containing protein [Verrucomicrobiae bacterium]